MKIKIVKEVALKELKENIQNNLDKYKCCDFSTFFNDPNNIIELDIDFDPDPLSNFTNDNTPEAEVNNCLLMNKSLSCLTPYIARDERLWVWLTHTLLCNYTYQRWVADAKGDNEISSRIKIHFFASDKRGIERDNAASRLWWLMYLCARVENISLKNSLDCFLQFSDVRANVIERPTISQCVNVFTAIINTLYNEYSNDRMEIFKRDIFRPLMRDLNFYGGIKLLSSMTTEDIESYLNTQLQSYLCQV